MHPFDPREWTSVRLREAAEFVLARSGRPMNASEIAREIRRDGLAGPGAEFTDKKLYHLLLNATATRRPVIVPVDRGSFAWDGEEQPPPITPEVREVEKALAELDAEAFEHLVAGLVVLWGYREVRITTPEVHHPDGGIDVCAVHEVPLGGLVPAVFAASHRAGYVTCHEVRALRGICPVGGQAVFITRGRFTPAAMVEARRPNALPLTLWNGRRLADHLLGNRIAIERATRAGAAVRPCRDSAA